MKYLENDYLYRYVALIHYWRSAYIHPETYCEIHHIIPKSLGGTDATENLIKVPASVHLQLHTLLPFFLENKSREKMVYAWNMLTNFAGVVDFDEYSTLKKDWAKYTSNRMKGNIPWNKGKRGVQVAWNKGREWTEAERDNIKKGIEKSDYVVSDETKKKQSVASSGENNAMFGLKGKAHPKTGFQESKTTRDRKSKALKDRPKTEEHKNNITKSWITRKKNIKTCPHCGFEGCNNMTRYHFDNCKLRNL